jgi:hypothetical protein
MGDNSTLDPKQDNSDCNSGEINMQENLNNLKRNHEMGNAVPISIIDLSQNDGDDGRIKKSFTLSSLASICIVLPVKC